MAPFCQGDCDGDGRVTVDELVRGVNVALGLAPVETCRQYAACSPPECVIIQLLVGAVDRALFGCPVSATFSIDGCVQHFSGCGGSLEFGTVHLSPLGRTASVDLGYFTFEGVPPGDYTLIYSPSCNPAGCTSPIDVRITNNDAYAAFWRS
jgi:hypothetical protein